MLTFYRRLGDGDFWQVLKLGVDRSFFIKDLRVSVAVCF
jgi:hypothetical protein